MLSIYVFSWIYGSVFGSSLTVLGFFGSTSFLIGFTLKLLLDLFSGWWFVVLASSFIWLLISSAVNFESVTIYLAEDLRWLILWGYGRSLDSFLTRRILFLDEVLCSIFWGDFVPSFFFLPFLLCSFFETSAFWDDFETADWTDFDLLMLTAFFLETVSWIILDFLSCGLTEVLWLLGLRVLWDCFSGVLLWLLAVIFLGGIVW